MPTRRRRWPAIIIGLIVILGLLWVAYSLAAQYAANTAIARVNSGPVGNANVACTGPTVGGFPFILDVRCERVTFAGAAEAITASLGGVAATAPLYWPGTVTANIDAPLVINAPAAGVALTTEWSVGEATASAWLGGLTGASAHFVGLKARNTGAMRLLPIMSVTAADASGGIAPAGGGSYTVSATARELVATRSDGGSFPKMDGEAWLTLVDVGSTLGTDPTETILAWLRRGGNAVTIDRFRIAAEGAVVTSDGSLRLSDTGKLNGSILLRWNDIKALADLIEAIMPGTRERAELPLQGLNALSVPVDTPDGKLHQTSLTFTDGVIWLGIFPLPIDPIPPIRF